ncbi:MAG: DUF4234 domain-containing protein [Bacteroidales bacterium]|nr:DUF4234 domain-containing protein [Bacteroidales bacterium]
MFNTKRGLLKYILLSLITFGIYSLVVMSHISEEINYAASPRDGKHTMHYLLMALIFSWLSLGIVPLVWFHRISNRIGAELSARNCDYSFSAMDFWLWNIVGSLILVGPFVYLHKLLKAMNLINADYLKNKEA